MQDICDLLTFEILSRVTDADRWLLRFVNKQFRKVVEPTPHDPRRRRVLDDVLEHAILNRGVSTVRFLFDMPSRVWATALETAAWEGSLEMVRLVVGRGDARSALMKALARGHVDVAEHLFTHHLVATESLSQDMTFWSANSRAAMEWTLSEIVPRQAAIVFAFQTACASGNAECAEYLCDVFGKDLFAPVVVSPCNSFPRVSVLRFLRSTFGQEADVTPILYNIRVPFHELVDILEYLHEIHQNPKRMEHLFWYCPSVNHSLHTNIH